MDIREYAHECEITQIVSLSAGALKNKYFTTRDRKGHVKVWSSTNHPDCIFTLFNFDADEKVMTDRILARSATSGRTDDNAEVLKNRFKDFKENQVPIIMSYGDKVKTIKADSSIKEISAQVQTTVKQWI